MTDSTTDKRVLRTKKCIHDTFISLLMTQDVKKITVKQLADAAGINRKTFYTYYTDIEDLFLQLQNSLVNKLAAEFCKFDLTSPDFSSLALFDSLQKVVSEDMPLYRRLNQLHAIPHIEILLKNIIVDIFNQHYENSFGLDCAEYTLYVEYFISGILSMYIKWLNDDSGITLEQMSEMASNVVLSGFAPILEKLIRETESEF